MVMAWCKIGLALGKLQKMTRWGYISGNGDTLGSAGPTVTRTSNTTPQNCVSVKTGLSEPQTFGGQQ